MPQQLDPQAVALAKAIRDTESKGDWNAKGQSGEWGAYQFMPSTWDAYSKEAGVNAVFGTASPDQQNQVAYHKIKQWKDAGYNPGQIASMWNAGPGKPNAYQEGFKGVNKQGVAYDTPTYAENVAKAYQRLKGSTALAMQPDVPMQPVEKNFFGDAGDTLSEAGGKIANAAGKTFTGEINPLSGLLQVGGGIAGGITGLVSDTLRHTPVVGGVYKGIEGLIGQGVQAVADTDIGQKGIKTFSDWAQAHPEAAANLEAVVDIASVVPVAKAAGIAKGAASTALKGSRNAVLETVSPRLTPKKLTEAIATRGVEKKGLLRRIDLKPDPRAVAIADVVKQNVPKFNPGKSLLHNISETQKVATAMNKKLKADIKVAAKDRIYSFKELASNLRNVEQPLMLSSDVTLSRAYKRVVDKALDIAKKKGGRVDTLLDTRQEFDAFVKKQFPNLYKSEQLTPMRMAISDIRDELTNFTVKNLPDGFGLKETLMTEHRLIKAIENMADKAAQTGTTEIGTTAIGRFGDKFPKTKGLIKMGGKAAAEGTGIGAVLKILD